VKIYIAGPIKGKENYNAAKFELYENKLIEMGHSPINPLSIKLTDSDRKHSDEEMNHIRKDLVVMLAETEGVVVMDDWEKSYGAVGEVRSAEHCQIPVYLLDFEKNELTPLKKKGGMKFDGDKLRWDLMPWVGLAEVAKVLTFGANKYEDNNWRKVPDHRRRYFAASMRHLMPWFISVLYGENHPEAEVNDKETHLHHLAAFAVNALFLLEQELVPKFKDGR